MSISNADINTLRAAISQYQAAVRKRVEDKRAQQEESREAIGTFLRGVFTFGGLALVIYGLCQVDWGAVVDSVKVIGVIAVVLGIIFLCVFLGMSEKGASKGESLGGAVFIVIFIIVSVIMAFRAL